MENLDNFKSDKEQFESKSLVYAEI